MKKLMKALLLAMTLVTILTVIPLPANASTSNKQKVFTYITEEMGLNSAAACGIMANIERESNFNSNCVIRDSNGKQSGGLCQWNGGRFNSLQRYCNNNGFNYLSVEGQLAYLKYELSQSSYKHIYNYLKGVSNSSSGAYNAGYYWCYYFEIPSNRATKAKQRGNTASSSYWPVFGNKKLDTPKLRISDNDVDLGDSITLSWSSGGSNATSYKLYVAEKNSDGKYDWKNSKIYKPTYAKQKISTKTLGEGYFAAYVKAVHGPSGGTSKASNTVTFTVRCKDHDYETIKVTKQPSLTTTGTKSVQCTTCGYKTTKKIAKVSFKDVENLSMSAPTATGRTTNAIALTWDTYGGADGYRLYVKNGNSWKEIGTVSADEGKRVRYDDLTPGTKYSFRAKFYVEKNGKRYYSKPSKVFTTATRPATPKLTSVVGHDNGTAELKWEKVKGADKYAIYACSPAYNKDDYIFIRYIDGSKTSCTAKVFDSATISFSFVVKAVVETDSGDVMSSASNSKSAYVL